jgi:hypothetical protein
MSIQVKTSPLGLLAARVAIVAILAIASPGAQPLAAASDPGREILERALYSERDARSKVPLSIIVSFLPSAHTESKLVIRFNSLRQAEVESIQPTVASGTVLQRVRGAGSVDIPAAVALMGVKRKRLSLDPKTASIWLKDFQTAVSASLDPMNKQSLEGPVQLDGTMYELLYRGDAEISITVPGCEVGSDCTKDIPLVRWMDSVRRTVEKMVDQAAN